VVEQPRPGLGQERGLAARLPPGHAGDRRQGPHRVDLPRPALLGPRAGDDRLRLQAVTGAHAAPVASRAAGLRRSWPTTPWRAAPAPAPAAMASRAAPRPTAITRASPASRRAICEQLLAFRDGRRQYALMTHLLEPLSDDFLRQLAAHFAALDLPYPPPQPGHRPAARARAEQLVTQGDAARAAGLQRLPRPGADRRAAGRAGAAGLPRDYLNAQLGAWRSGTRHARAPDCMADIARRLAPEDIAALSAWLSARPVPVPARAAATLPRPAAALRQRAGAGAAVTRGAGTRVALASCRGAAGWCCRLAAPWWDRAADLRSAPRRRPRSAGRGAAPTWRASATAPVATPHAAAPTMPAVASSTRPSAAWWRPT
jgi:cytochrome c553